MDLKETANLMLDKDYKKRFIAEYWQLKNRYDGLHKMLVKYDAGTLDFKPSCSYDLLSKQARSMGEYLYYLEVRAEIEKIDLHYYEKVTGPCEVVARTADVITTHTISTQL